jgi:hypothetical protein
MGVEGSTGICRLLQTLGATRRGDPLSRSFFRLHHWSSFLERRFIGRFSLNRRSSGSILFQVLVVTAKGIKSKDLAYIRKKGKLVQDKILSQQKLMSLRGRKVPHPHGEQKAPR